MTQRNLEKQRLFSIVAFRDTTNNREAYQAYLKEYGEIRYQQVTKLLVELSDDGTIERVKAGKYRRPA